VVTTPGGVPVAFTLLPAGFHDRTPVHDLTFPLPPAAGVYTDKADNSRKDEASILADTGVRLVPIRKANMTPNPWTDRLVLRPYRPRTETTNGQLAAMGIQRLRARTTAGFGLKVHASLVALTLVTARSQSR
jgi:hypothetical protein